MNIIKRIDGAIIAQSETKSIKELAEENKYNLSGADFSGAELFWADLRNADRTVGVIFRCCRCARRMLPYRLCRKLGLVRAGLLTPPEGKE